MSNNKQAAVQPATATAATADNLPSQAVGQPKAVFDFSTAEMPDTSGLSKAKPSDISISAQYYEFVQGEQVRGVYMGTMPYTFISQYTQQEETIEVAVFVNEQRQIRFNGAVKFKTALERLPSKTPFVAVMTGIVAKKGRNIQQFDVYLLNTTA